MKTKNIFRFFLVFLFLVSLSLSTAMAGDYPEKPITLIIPLGAGGSHDLNARVFTSVIPTYLNQAIIIKLMPGAGGQTGTAAAVRAKPDGYTLLFTHNFIDQLQPLVEKLPYDTTKELDEMLDYGRKNPGKLTFASSGKWGAGFVPAAVMLSQAGVEANFIPYKGGGPALQACLAGDVDFTNGFPAQSLPHYKTGKLRFLAVASDKRLKECPKVPTFKELGYPTESLFMSRIIMAPRETPPERINILREAFRKIYTDKTFKNLMNKLGENLEHMDGPDYEKVRATQKKEYQALVKKILGQ